MSPRKKIPTKTELAQLQKLYRTDEKIGERLGGVPAYLVAYWRRKKGVPRYSQPKFSEAEVRNLWERYGDDDKCGLELGISKAAFYNWRRRYGIREKPAFLKLEQLELAFPGMKTHSRAVSLYGKQTVAQKVLAHAADSDKAEIGETIEVEPDALVCHRRLGEVVGAFREAGTEYVFNPSRLILSLDSCADSADDLKLVREFARRQSIRALYDFRDGACHQVVVENGHILPGQLALGVDVLTTAYGSLSAVALAIDPARMGRIWATGKAEVEVPGSLRIDISGRRARGVYARDIIMTIAKKLGNAGARGKAIEFYGSGVSQMSVNERLTLSALAAELGAMSALCAFDSTTRRYLTGRTGAGYTPVAADKDAEYEAAYQINVEQLAPQISCGGPSDQIKAVAEVQDLPVQQIVVGTCTNGRFEDLRIVAEVLKNKQVHRDCRLLIYPASRAVYLEALKKGLIRVLVEAGAVIMPPGCGGSPDGAPTLARGERCLTTAAPLSLTGRGEAGEVYYCSPATAAASALNGVVTDPTGYVK